MLKRYLGQIGQDRTVVKFLLNYYGPDSNEYFEEPGIIMTTGSVKVSMPFQSGIIEKVIFVNSSDYSMNLRSSFRFWMFQDSITSAVRGSAKSFTSSELDSFVGSFDIRNSGDVDPPNTDPWITGIGTVPYANMLQKIVNIPFVINSENPTLEFVQEYIGEYTSLYRQYIYCYLILKRD